jgi:hypothetical protein
VNVRVAGLNVDPWGRLLAEYVRGLPLASVAETWKVRSAPSFTRSFTTI